MLGSLGRLGPRPPKTALLRAVAAQLEERDFGWAEEANPWSLSSFTANPSADVEQVFEERMQSAGGDRTRHLAQGHGGAESGDDDLASMRVAGHGQVDPRMTLQSEGHIGAVGHEDADVIVPRLHFQLMNGCPALPVLVSNSTPPIVRCRSPIWIRVTSLTSKPTPAA